MLTKENTRDRIATCGGCSNFETLKINKKTEVKVQLLTSVFFWFHKYVLDDKDSCGYEHSYDYGALYVVRCLRECTS